VVERGPHGCLANTVVGILGGLLGAGSPRRSCIRTPLTVSRRPRGGISGLRGDPPGTRCHRFGRPATPPRRPRLAEAPAQAPRPRLPNSHQTNIGRRGMRGQLASRPNRPEGGRTRPESADPSAVIARFRPPTASMTPDACPMSRDGNWAMPTLELARFNPGWCRPAVAARSLLEILQRIVEHVGMIGPDSSRTK